MQIRKHKLLNHYSYSKICITLLLITFRKLKNIIINNLKVIAGIKKKEQFLSIKKIYLKIVQHFLSN